MKNLLLTLILAIPFVTFAQINCANQNFPAELAFIPWPQSVSNNGGSLSLTASSQIKYTDASLQQFASILQSDIVKNTGLNLQVNSGSGGNGDIELSINPSLADEGYSLTVNSKITIIGRDYKSVVWGGSSLLQALECDGTINNITVNDSPETGYRGLMVDLARQWHPISNLEDIINMCRLYKINYLHLHLMDTQSFTFPSQTFPLLASPGNSYTLAELNALEAYSQARGVTIVPELEVPGHATRMIQTYPNLFGSGTSGAINIARADVRAAVGTLVNEISDVFQATPYFHIGCDEVDKSGMGSHPDYINAIAQLGVGDVNGLFNYFIDETTGYVEARGKRALAWEGFDSGRTGAAEVNKNLIVCPFDNYTSSNTYAANGHDILNTSWFPLYLVPNTYVPPSKIYNWEVAQFGNYNGASPRSHNNVNQYLMSNTGKLIGAQTCSWEQKAEFEVPSLRSRISPMSERVWNTNAGLSFSNYQSRFEKSDQVLTNILATSLPESITPSASFEIFSNKINISWRPRGGYPNSYTLYRSTSDNSATATAILSNTSASSYQDFNVSAGQTYYYWIKAKNSIGEGPFGNSADGKLGNSSLTMIYEPFNYTNNSSPNGQSGGSGFNGSWNITESGGSASISSQSLTYPNLQTSGNSLAINMSGASNSFNMERTLAGSLCPEGSEVWISFLFKANSLDAGHCFLNIGNGSVGKVWGNGIEIPGIINAQLALVEGETSLVVLKISSHNGSDDIHIWTNPVVNNTEPDTNAPNCYFTDRLDMGTNPKMGFNVQHHYGGGSYEFDEIRIGDSFDDVLPTGAGNGCSASILCFANVNNQGWQSVCDVELASGQTVTFGPSTDPLINNGTWSWTGPNGFSGNTREITVSNPGAYTVTFNDGNCTYSQILTVSSEDVNCDNPPSNQCQYTTNYQNYINTCDITVDEGELLVYTFSGCDANLSLNLTGPNGFNQNSVGVCGEIIVSNSVTPNMTGTYTATLTDNTTGCFSAQTVNITIVPINCDNPPSNQCQYTTNYQNYINTCDITVDEGELLVYTFSGCDANLSLNLTGPNGFNQNSVGVCGEIIVSNSVTPNMTGTYTATLTDNTTGCSSVQTVNITVLPNNDSCDNGQGGNTVQGTVWVDSNGDGIRNAGEGAIPGVTVRLFHDHNNDGFVERMVCTTQSGSDGSYSFSFSDPGKYQVGIDPLSLPDDKYRMTDKDASGNESIDNDVSKHTFRSDEFETSQTDLDIGILQGNGNLIYLGEGEVNGQPVHQWLFQDIHFQIQNTGLDPNDSNYRNIIETWMRWYAVGERIIQEAEILPNYLNLARHNNSATDISVKYFHTVDGLGSYASGRGAVSSGIPATTLLNNPNVIEDHILMYYETTRGANPIWKYRSNWPFGARLTHHSITSMTLLELGGMTAFLANPNITSWNPGRDGLNNIDRWERTNTTMANAFPIDPNKIINQGELVNHFSIDLTDPDNPGQTYSIGSRDLLISIITKIVADLGREKGIEVFHNMSRKSWYSPSRDQGLIHFKQAVNDATDGAYAADFTQKWGFPTDDTYNNPSNTNSGNFVSQSVYNWDLKPHNYASNKIRSGYTHLSDRTSQGFVKWIDNDGSDFRNLGAEDFLQPAGDITYPNQDARMVIGEGVSFAHQLDNGSWTVELNIVNGSPSVISFEDQVTATNDPNVFTVFIQDGELNMSFNGQIRLAEMIISQDENACPNGDPICGIYDFFGEDQIFYIEAVTNDKRLAINCQNFNITMDDAEDVNAQKWKLIGWEGNFALKNMASGEYLIVPSNTCGNGVTFGTNLTSDHSNERWNIQLVDGHYYLRPLSCPVHALDQAGPHLWNFGTANQNQRFRLISTSISDVSCCTNEGQICDDGDSCSETSLFDVSCNCSPMTNFALSSTASMSSIYGAFVAEHLNDDNYSQFAHTNGSSTHDWMQLDLGEVKSIQQIVIWNRTDCCTDRLSKCYLMVSDSPFPNNTDVDASLSNADFIYQFEDTSTDALLSIPTDLTGRYLRIQKSGNNPGGNYLNLSEIGVFGEYSPSDDCGECTDDILCFSNIDNQGWQQSCDVNLVGGESVTFGPQTNPSNIPGSWSWSGPNGYSANTREISVVIGGQYEVTFNGGDCTYTQVMNVNVDCTDLIVETLNNEVTNSKNARIGIESNQIIPANANIDFHAGEYVLMQAGFEVKPNAVFHAFIEGCE